MRWRSNQPKCNQPSSPTLHENGATSHYLIEGGPLQQRMTLGSFLYENEAETGPLLEIPEQFTDEE